MHKGSVGASLLFVSSLFSDLCFVFLLQTCKRSGWVLQKSSLRDRPWERALSHGPKKGNEGHEGAQADPQKAFGPTKTQGWRNELGGEDGDVPEKEQLGYELLPGWPHQEPEGGSLAKVCQCKSIPERWPTRHHVGWCGKRERLWPSQEEAFGQLPEAGGRAQRQKGHVVQGADDLHKVLWPLVCKSFVLKKLQALRKGCLCLLCLFFRPNKHRRVGAFCHCAQKVWVARALEESFLAAFQLLCTWSKPTFLSVAFTLWCEEAPLLAGKTLMTPMNGSLPWGSPQPGARRRPGIASRVRATARWKQPSGWSWRPKVCWEMERTRSWVTKPWSMSCLARKLPKGSWLWRRMRKTLRKLCQPAVPGARMTSWQRQKLCLRWEECCQRRRQCWGWTEW